MLISSPGRTTKDMTLVGSKVVVSVISPHSCQIKISVGKGEGEGEELMWLDRQANIGH